MKKSLKKVGHIVSHTHWDREWRYPIWKNRVLLEYLMINLLDLLEGDSGYQSFVLDAQSVAIEDFLDVRPDQNERVKKMVKNDRIQIGPWYTLPDQFSVCGESIVRNLMEGRRYCDGIGKTMKIGYTTFGWGQPSQMPQIYSNFGIDVVLGGKNVSQEKTGYNEYIWEGADGTSLLASKLGVQARANFFKYAVIPLIYGIDNIGPDWKFIPDDKGVLFHRSDTDNYWQDYHRRNFPLTIDKSNIKEKFESAWKTTDGSCLDSDRVLFDGGDFTESQPLLSEMIEKANELFEDKQFIHEPLDSYVNVIKEKINRDVLNVVKGELRDGPEQSVTPNALASRSDIKRANRIVENSLYRIAEPLCVMALMAGGEYPENYLKKALNYLLKAHPHDSINGVTQDKTSRDTLYRIEQAKELAEVISDEAMFSILKKIDIGNEPETVYMVIFNTLPFEDNRIVSVVVDTPEEWNADTLAVFDSKGNELDCSQTGREKTIIPVNEATSRPWPFSVNRHFVDLDTGSVPAMGYKVLRIKPKAKFEPEKLWPPTQLKKNTLVPRDGVLENEFLRVEVNANGSFDLFDKINEKNYTGLHYFEDSGDAGDAWLRYVPNQNKILNTLGANAKIYTCHDSDLCGTIAIEIQMDVPQKMDRQLNKRSEFNTSISIKSELTLRQNQRRVDIKTSINNTAEDHRMRVMFPTDLQANESEAEGHFTVEKRPIEPQLDGEGAYRPGMQTLPHQSFVDLSDGNNGLAIINDGLLEYEVLNESRHTVVITLFRSTKMRICTEPRVGAEFPTQTGWQMPGLHEFKYSVYPHKGNWCEGGVYWQSQKLNIPLQLIQTNAHKGKGFPENMSFLSIDSEIIQVSSLKKARDRCNIILRLFNPSSENAETILKFAYPVESAYIVNMNEERIEKLESGKSQMVIKVDSQKVETIEIDFKTN